MLLNVRFKLVSEFVQSITPLSTTTSLSDALKVSCDIEDLDSVINVLWNNCENIIDATKAIKLQVLFYDTEDNLIGKLLAVKTGISVTLMDDVSSDTKRAFAGMIETLSDYFASKALELTVAADKGLDATSALVAATTCDEGTAKDAVSELSREDAVLEAVRKKSKADIVKPKETLEDYVCNDTLRNELQEVVSFVRDAKEYADMGIKLPKGILFKGIPGTGKTYAARCIAGSCDCYFMVCTASSLQGMYIGSGAENVRNVFEGARVLHTELKKPVMIFIDELDSFGSRDNHGGNAGGEEDRTLNQLLAELSGFEEAEGITVLGATNYPERLDDALMRSGRFSRQITIEPPELDDRVHLAEYYFKKIKIPCTVDSCEIAELTEGMTPADISEVANECAILCVRECTASGKPREIQLDHVNEAINKVITKNIRKPDKSKEFQELVAAHECGHVLAEILYSKRIPLKVTSYSYGNAGGFTQKSVNPNTLQSKEEYLNEIYGLLGGRAAEEVYCGFITVGASEDLARAEKLLQRYYQTYLFETYKVSDLEQLVQDKLMNMYHEVFDKLAEYKDVLSRLTKKLCTARILYKSDLSAFADIEKLKEL